MAGPQPEALHSVTAGDPVSKATGGARPGWARLQGRVPPTTVCFSFPFLAPPPGPAPRPVVPASSGSEAGRHPVNTGAVLRASPGRVTTEQGTLLGPPPQGGESPAWVFTGGTRLPTAVPAHRKAACRPLGRLGAISLGPPGQPEAAAWTPTAEIARRPWSREDPVPRGDAGGQGSQPRPEAHYGGSGSSQGVSSQPREGRTLGSDLSLFYRSSQLRRR